MAYNDENNDGSACWSLTKFIAERVINFCRNDYTMPPICEPAIEEKHDGTLSIISIPGGLGNAGDFATTIGDLLRSAFACNAALMLPSAFTSYLVGYANSLEFKKFLKDCFNTPLTCFRMLEFIPRTILATGNFFYNALLNNWSALSAFLVYALTSLGFGSMSGPVLLAMITPQVIGTMTNMPVYDAFKDTLSELKDALLEMKRVFAGLCTGETSCEDLAWFGVKLTGVLLSVGIALLTDFPNYFFAAYQGFARYGGEMPKLWLKIASLLFAFVGGVDVPIVAKTIYRTAEKMINDLYTGKCHSVKKSMLIFGCSLIGAILVWRMGIVDPSKIEKITQEILGLLLKNTKSIEDALKFIAKFISPFCMGISGFFLTKDKIDRKEVFEMLNRLKNKLCGCAKKKAFVGAESDDIATQHDNSIFSISNCYRFFFKKTQLNTSVNVVDERKANVPNVL